MKHKILDKLHQTERENNIKILHAVESGSRAWGFASPDSDYDIRFIYMNSKDWYLSLWERKDVIEFMTVENFDGSGWDLAKALQLLSKSNGPLIEWLFSPVVYYQNDEFLNEMQSLARECFSPIATIHHYLGTTKNFIEVCEAEQVKLKSYFYALRTALAGRWIIEEGSFPPVAFNDLLPIAPHSIRELAIELIELKSLKDEKYLHPKESLITSYLLETIRFNQEMAPKLSSGKKLNNRLDEFFRSQLYKYDN